MESEQAILALAALAHSTRLGVFRLLVKHEPDGLAAGENLPQSIGFYSELFAAQPAVVKPDYAKRMLDDPRVNFAISTRGRQVGLDHLGIQVENADELAEVYERLHKAGGDVIEQGQT